MFELLTCINNINQFPAVIAQAHLAIGDFNISCYYQKRAI